MDSTCPKHGHMMQDLALGVLADDQATIAESLRVSCPTCRDSWDHCFAGDTVRRVDRAVEDSFNDFQPPEREKSAGWLPLAAAAALALGVGLVLQLADEGGAPAPSPIAKIELAKESFEIDLAANGQFELANLTLETSETSAGIATSDQDRQVIFQGGLESGDFATWSPEG